MAVGVVARDSLAEPQDVRHAELVAQDRFDLAPPEPRVSDLHRRIEQTLLGREERAPTIHIDAAALEHDVALAGAGAEQAHLALRGRALRNARILLPVAVLGPGVELEPYDRELGARGASAHEQRPEIASPATIRRKPEELHSCEIDAHLPEHPPRLPFVRGGAHQDAGDFTRGERAHDLAVHPGDQRQLAGPIARVVRPSEPRCVMRLSLGGHTEAADGRGVGAGGRGGTYGWTSRKRLPIPA